MTLMMEMMYLDVATSESPNQQTGATIMHGHHNLDFGAWCTTL